MGLFFADLVRERSTSTGTGPFALDGALPGHRAFAGTVPPGARFHYSIAGVTHPDQWETGEGELSGGALARTPLSSSAGGAATDFSPGLKTVALTVAAAWFAGRDGPLPLDGVGGLQAALDGKQASDPVLASLASLDGTAGSIPYFTGTDSLALAATSGFGRELVAVDSVTALRSAIGLAGDPVFTGTVHAGAAAVSGSVSAGAVMAGTDRSFGAVTAVGGTPFSTLPEFGTASIGRIQHSSGWSGSGFLIANADTGAKAFSLVCNLDCAFFGFIEAAGSQVVLILQPDRAEFFNNVVVGAAGVSIGGAPVLGGRRGGWTGATGSATRSGFDTATVTTAQLAERVKALIDDLVSHGLIGS